MKTVQTFSMNNPLHKAIFLCVVTGGAGDCRLVEFGDATSGRVFTKKQYGAGTYKWALKNNQVYCCRQVVAVEEGMRHPYYNYTLADALSLAATLKRERLFAELKTSEARELATFTIDRLEEAIQVMKEEVSCSTFNWITGRVALQVLRATFGEKVTFTV